MFYLVWRCPFSLIILLNVSLSFRHSLSAKATLRTQKQYFETWLVRCFFFQLEEEEEFKF
jgi:hypothetical protein